MAKVTPIYKPVKLTFFDKDGNTIKSNTINGYEEAVRVATETTMWNNLIVDYTINDID